MGIGLKDFYNWQLLGSAVGAVAGAGVTESAKNTPQATAKADLGALDGKLPPNAPGAAPYTPEQLQAAIQNANGGQLLHADGSPMTPVELEQLTQLYNDPQQRAALERSVVAAESKASGIASALKQTGDSGGGIANEVRRHDKDKQETDSIVPDMERRLSGAGSK